jgi:hypothetical protein
MISLQSGKDMAEQNQILIGAIRKLALAGEQAGFSVEEIIELLKTGASVETLLDLLRCTDRHIDFGCQIGEVERWPQTSARSARKPIRVESAITMTKVNAPKRLTSMSLRNQSGRDQRMRATSERRTDDSAVRKERAH